VRPCVYAAVLGWSHPLSGTNNLIMWAIRLSIPFMKQTFALEACRPAGKEDGCNRSLDRGMTYQVRRCIVYLTGSREARRTIAKSHGASTRAFWLAEYTCSSSPTRFVESLTFKLELSCLAKLESARKCCPQSG
jgi:hypothetical protein